MRGDLQVAASAAPAIPRRDARVTPQLSFAQERLWFLDQLMPNSAVFNVPMALRISQPLDVTILQQCVDEIVTRHEVFRTAFTSTDGIPAPIISPSSNVPIELVDLTAIASTEREVRAHDFVQGEVGRTFDLGHAPLIRVKLIKLTPHESIFILTMHHIISDGNSILIFFRELSALYEAFINDRPSPLAALPIQYADYALWQKNWLRDDFISQQIGYWKEKLSGSLPVLDLQTDHPRPAIQTHSGARVTLTLSEDLTRRLKELSQREGATLFMTLLSGFKALLRRLSNQEDIIVGSPISNRPRRETENLIGFFLNNLALRTDLSGDPTFSEVVSRVRRTALDAYANQDVPFEKLLEEIKPERDLSRTSIFQVYFNLFSFSDRLDLPGGDSINFVDGWLQTDETLAKFDLTLYAGAGEREIKLALVYNTDLFSRARMEEMLAQLEHVLAQAVRNPDQKVGALSLVTLRAHTVLPDPTDVFAPSKFKSIAQHFSEQAQTRPEDVAVVDSRSESSYEAIDDQTNQLANALRENGVTKGDVIAIYGHRSTSLVTAIIGVLKAGAAFTILDPAYPVARLIDCLCIANPRGWIRIGAAGTPPAELIDAANSLDCGCQIILSTTGEDALARYSTDNPNVPIDAHDLAYISFTSGSTGKPKGVMGRHGPLTLFTAWAVERFGLNESDRFCMLSGLAHDPLHRDIFTPLQIGGTVCIPAPEIIESPERLRSWMAESRITIANLTPAMSQLLTDGLGDERIASLRYSFLVGDALTRRDVKRLHKLAPSITCINLYGSTETQRAVGHYVASSQSDRPQRNKDILPLGKGIRDVQLLVLTPNQKLCGIGEPGEIYFRSPHLAKGYLNDAKLTSERFIPNPFNGDHSDRLYRTGDLGCYLADGNVEHLGRADRQVKIRGFRIEPAEIEAALTQHPSIRDAVVIATNEKGVAEQKRLVAYVTSDHKDAIDTSSVHHYLAGKLPQFMIPSAIVVLDSLPLTPNGKLDRAALPAPSDLNNCGSEKQTAPQTTLEKEMAALWQEVMSIDRFGIHDNFFELGGHSLLAVRLFALIEKRFGKRLPLATLFQAPTIAQLAAVLETNRTQSSSLVAIQSHGSRPPLFCVHAVGGNVLEYYDLSRHLGDDQPFYGLQSRGSNGEDADTTIQDMATHYVNEMRRVQPHGPYLLGGRSLGGIIAYEMACQLSTVGEEIALLALLDSYPVGYDKVAADSSARTASRFSRRVRAHVSNISSLPVREKVSYITSKSKYGPVRIKSRAWRTIYRAFKRIGRDLPKHLRDVEEFNWLAAQQFVPRKYDGCVTLFWASKDLRAKFDMIEGWQRLARNVVVKEVSGTHLDIIKEPHVADLAGKLLTSLTEVQPA